MRSCHAKVLRCTTGASKPTTLRGGLGTQPPDFGTVTAAFPLHKSEAMRASVPLALWLLGSLVSSPARAQEAPLAMAEARLGQGVALGGGSGESSWRISPLSLSILGSIAIRESPWLMAFGGLVLEGNGRGGAGATAGLRFYPGAADIRVSAAGVAMALPYKAYGASAGVGRCYNVRWSVGVCTDLEASLFAWGDDVPEERIATQVVAVMGVALDVF